MTTEVRMAKKRLLDNRSQKGQTQTHLAKEVRMGQKDIFTAYITMDQQDTD